MGIGNTKNGPLKHWNLKGTLLGMVLLLTQFCSFSHCLHQILLWAKLNAHLHLQYLGKGYREMGGGVGLWGVDKDRQGWTGKMMNANEGS